MKSKLERLVDEAAEMGYTLTTREMTYEELCAIEVTLGMPPPLTWLATLKPKRGGRSRVLRARRAESLEILIADTLLKIAVAR